MGENSGTAYLLAGMIMVFILGLLFISALDIQAFTFFKGVT